MTLLGLGHQMVIEIVIYLSVSGVRASYMQLHFFSFFQKLMNPIHVNSCTNGGAYLNWSSQ